MMEPLSATASILTVLAASSAVLNVLRSIGTRSKVLRRLEIETKHLEDSIKAVETLINVGLPVQSVLLYCIIDAHCKLQEIQGFIQKHSREN